MSYRKEFRISRFLLRSICEELESDGHAYLSVHNDFKDSIDSVTTAYMFSVSPPRRFSYQQLRSLPRRGRHGLESINILMTVNYIVEARIIVENEKLDSLSDPDTTVRIEAGDSVFNDWRRSVNVDELIDHS